MNSDNYTFLRGEYLLDLYSITKIQGQPFKSSEIIAEIESSVVAMSTNEEQETYSKKDFMSDQMIGGARVW